MAPRSRTCTKCERVIPFATTSPSWALDPAAALPRLREPFSIRYPIVKAALTGVILPRAVAAVRLGIGLVFGSLRVQPAGGHVHRPRPPHHPRPHHAAKGIVVKVSRSRSDERVVRRAGFALAPDPAVAIGTLVGGGIPWLVAWGYALATGREGMGGGDIKLLAMIGAFLGWQGVLLTLLLAPFIGRRGDHTVGRGDAKLAILFGPFPIG